MCENLFLFVYREKKSLKSTHEYISIFSEEEGSGTHSSALAWRIPGTGEPGGLPSLGSHRVGHD